MGPRSFPNVFRPSARPIPLVALATVVLLLCWALWSGCFLPALQKPLHQCRIKRFRHQNTISYQNLQKLNLYTSNFVQNFFCSHTACQPFFDVWPFRFGLQPPFQLLATPVQPVDFFFQGPQLLYLVLARRWSRDVAVCGFDGLLRSEFKLPLQTFKSLNLPLQKKTSVLQLSPQPLFFMVGVVRFLA